MPFWTWIGLQQGEVTTEWPNRGTKDGQQGVLGMPRYTPERCQEGCEACVEACLPGAIGLHGEGGRGEPRLRVDYGRCIACQMCVEACPYEAFERSQDWAFGVRSREDLHWKAALDSPVAEDVRNRIRKQFRGSLHIRHVDAGSCNGCESELQALGNPFYNLHRLGIFFTPSPRFADLLLVTGPVTHALREPLHAAYEAMPEPRWVMAIGTCAVSGGVCGGGYACGRGVEELLPVDIYLPGCPPNPAAIIEALLLLLRRGPQRVRGGRRVS